MASLVILVLALALLILSFIWSSIKQEYSALLFAVWAIALIVVLTPLAERVGP